MQYIDKGGLVVQQCENWIGTLVKKYVALIWQKDIDSVLLRSECPVDWSILYAIIVLVQVCVRP